MSNVTVRIKKRKKAKEILNNISESQSDYLIIHYSCESFFDLPEGNTPRITSIAVRYVRNAQTKSFSIHKIAELKHINPTQINQYYNELEKEMLEDYFSFVDLHKEYKWIHINMRNINYGFEAINHRFRVLGGNPIEISDNLKIDLARVLVDLYGKNYSPHPRLENLYNRNKITMSDFMNGNEEAEAFKNGDYVSLHRSTLRKVDNMHNVIMLANEDDLKTDTNILRFYGFTPTGLFASAKENWIIALVMFILGGILMFYVTVGLSSLTETKKQKTDTTKIELTKK